MAKKTATSMPRQNKGPNHPREKILRVALELFTKQGYEATSIDEIREAAEFRSKASLYAHFKNKEEISEELKKRILGQIEQSLFTAYEAAAPHPLSQFIAVIRAYVRWALTNRQEFAFRIIRAQEERMLKGYYDWEKDPDRSTDQSSAPRNVYNLILGIIKQLQKKEYPVRHIPEAALVHMMVGAVSRAAIDRDSFRKVHLSDTEADWFEQVDLVLEVCMGIVFSEPVALNSANSIS